MIVALNIGAFRIGRGARALTRPRARIRNSRCVRLVLVLTCSALLSSVPASAQFSSANFRGERSVPLITEQPEPADTAGSLTPRDTERPNPLSRPLQRPDPEAKSASSRRPSFWTSLIVLSVIVAGLLAAARLLKRHGPRASGGLPAEALEHLGRRTLEQRLSIHLVRCGSRILVLGSSADGLRTLSEITDPVEVDLLAGLCRRRDESSGMAQSFRTLFGKYEAHPRESAPRQMPLQAYQSPADLESDEYDEVLEDSHA